MKSKDELYQHWLKQRRSERPDPELSDRVMAAVTQVDISQPGSRLVLVLMWIECSRLRRLSACVGALLVGSMPFIYLAYISQVFII